jgi:hypothetical protein
MKQPSSGNRAAPHWPQSRSDNARSPVPLTCADDPGGAAFASVDAGGCRGVRSGELATITNRRCWDAARRNAPSGVGAHWAHPPRTAGTWLRRKLQVSPRDRLGDDEFAGPVCEKPYAARMMVIAGVERGDQGARVTGAPRP